jgi:hypothetical protein
MSGISTNPHFSGGTGENHTDVSQDDCLAEFRTGHLLNVRQKEC